SASSSRSSSPSRVKKYLCTIPDCGRAYTRPSLLEQHQRSHTKDRPFQCTVTNCTESFTRKDHLNRHLLAHTSEESKPFHCSICGKGVNTKQHLKRHEKTHFKSFHCDHESCNESFYKHQSLKAHVNSVHDNQRLKCKECGKLFSRPGRLSEHYQRHHNTELEATKLVCEFPGCFKNFKIWSALQLHVKTDHPKIPCEICGKKCVGPSGLANHIKIHDEDKAILLWKCLYCSTKFLKKDELLKHYEELHPELESEEQEEQEEQEEEEHSMDEVLSSPVTKKLSKLLKTASPTSVLDMITSNIDERVIECPKPRCDRKFKKEYDLKRHLIWHEKR
ncbi:hypothetical protein CANARDRAFT_181321, partial [[Candida] arabinofermentans NRRL YB-2248]